MGPVLRVVSTWVVMTALLVLGVNAAIERVARDVSIARPAPMTPGDVDEQLREQRGTPPPTTVEGVWWTDPTSVPTTDDRTSTPSPVSTTAPHTGTPPNEPSRPDVTRPSTPGGPAIDVATTTLPRGGADRSGEREQAPRP